MKKPLILLAAMAVANTMTVNAASVTLFDWAVNIDGTAVCPDDFSCASAALPSSVDASGFDFGPEIDPGTGIGSISYTITGTGDHYAGFYVDHDVGSEFFDEFGSSGGAPLAAGQSWEVDDPFFGDIFVPNFLNSSLDNSNGVSSGDNDVAMALAWNFTLGEGVGFGETATIDFILSEIMPTGFFLLSLTDPETTVYFSSSLSITSNPVPVPAAVWLFGSGLIALMGAGVRRKSQQAQAL